jgi:hypothetical protein
LRHYIVDPNAALLRASTIAGFEVVEDRLRAAGADIMNDHINLVVTAEDGSQAGA